MTNTNGFSIFLESLAIKADHIEFSGNTTLDEPQQRSLYGLTGKDENSMLVLSDVYLNDPAKGTLFTKMPNVEFKNIKVYGDCKCDLLENLACNKNDFGMNETLSCKDLKDLLINATLCQVR